MTFELVNPHDPALIDASSSAVPWPPWTLAERRVRFNNRDGTDSNGVPPSLESSGSRQ